MRTHALSVEALEQIHRFPGSYVVRAIGDNTSAFMAAVVQAVAGVLGAESPPVLATRTSAGGRHLSVRLDCAVQSAEQVVELYAALQKVAGVRMLL